MGDNSDLINKLKLIYDKCDDIDLLYGASRTKGETVKIINDIAKEKMQILFGLQHIEINKIVKN